MWAAIGLKDVLTFGNKTNNRVENAHGQLKKLMPHNLSLAKAVANVWAYANRLEHSVDSRLAMNCDRRCVYAGDAYVVNVIKRLTTYAADLVVKNVEKWQMNAHYELISENKVQMLYDLILTLVHGIV